MKKITIFLAIIIFAFLFTRLFNITSNPPSVYWDEASIGYNAYSITQDAKDEWGEFLPLHFRAFGEFKLPVYVYSVTLMSYLFGLSILSVRLPSVLFSLGIVVITYFLTYELTRKKYVGLLSSLILAFTPWLFIFSRTGYEATAGLFFYLTGIYLFLKGKSKNILLLASFVSFIASMYSYNSFRIISLLTLVILTLYLFLETKDIKKILGVIIVGVVMVLVSFIPMYKLYTKDFGGVRFQQVALQGSNAEKISAFIDNYMSHFSFDFLFVNGDSNPRSQMPGYGQMFIVTLPLLLTGLYVIVKAREKKLWLIVILLLISVIPASLTRESPHALRSISAAPFISMISAMGIYFFYLVSRKKPAVILFFVSMYIIFFVGYFVEFITNYNYKYAKEWQYDYKSIYTDYKDEIENHDQVVISDEYGQPYIFTLFYLKYPPDQFRNSVKYNPVDKWGFSTVESFDKFTFKKVNESDMDKDTLYLLE